MRNWIKVNTVFNFSILTNKQHNIKVTGRSVQRQMCGGTVVMGKVSVGTLDVVGICYGTCQRVLTKKLGMHHVTAKFVPRILAADHTQQPVKVCTELRQLANDDETFLSRVITGDESWVYGYDSETKQQSSQWKSPTS